MILMNKDMEVKVEIFSSALQIGNMEVKGAAYL
jgi:hypothetical protein